jgi:hypothetical protein
VPRGETDTAFARLAAFVAALPDRPWFEEVGAKLTSAVIAEAEAYVAALGLAPCPVAAAGAMPRRSRSDRIGAAAGSRPNATASGCSIVGSAPLLAALSDVTEAASVLRDRAAAAQACHQQALALLADGEAGSAFVAKYALYAAGRWPLGIVGGTGFVF